MFHVKLSENEAARLHLMVRDRMHGIKNHIATAVEDGRLADAQAMVKDLRAYEAIGAKLNVEAHKLIEALRCA